MQMNVFVSSLVIVTKWKDSVTETRNVLSVLLGIGYLAYSDNMRSMLLLYAFRLFFLIRSHIASIWDGEKLVLGRHFNTQSTILFYLYLL